MHATVLHGGMSYNLQLLILSLTLEIDLIPLEQFLDRYSPLLQVYIYGYCVCTFATSTCQILMSLKGADFFVRKLNCIRQLADYYHRRCGVIYLLYSNAGW
jgi:hypothetical protein